MATYSDLAEPAFANHGWIKANNQGGEALNFLAVQEKYYGFVQHNDKSGGNGVARISIEKLGKPTGDIVGGITVVLCASDPTTDKLLVVGWYNEATVYRNYIRRPDTDKIEHIRFTSKKAVLIPESKRAFEIPRARSSEGRVLGGFGQSDIWYGIMEPKAEKLRKELFKYIERKQTDQTVIKSIEEQKKERLAKRFERIGATRGFIFEKGFCCEACDWEIEKSEQSVWGSSFELHHLHPFKVLGANEKRRITKEAFAVLCASCHRAIHRTDYVSDIDAFKKNFITNT